MLVDIVDDKNQTIGLAQRADVLRRHFNFRTVHGIIFAEHRLLVLQRLPLDHPRNPGRLGSSVAGYLQAGELYEDAIHRKLRDELRLDADMRSLGELEMIDEESHKFVGVFSGEINARPDFDRDQIAELVYLSSLDLRALLAERSELFTPTFKRVYAHYLGRAKAAP